jgi:antirestriction protein ArdC
MNVTTAPTTRDFASLLESAVNEPGTIHSAYTAFHGYSLGNQLLALSQCSERGIIPGPLATYPKWLELGRHVRYGERALVLCMPVTVRAKKAATDSGDDAPECFTRFVHRPNWFTLVQTDGAELVSVPIPSWDSGHALAMLGIEEVGFAGTNGNVMGCACGREITVSPLNPLPHKTRFHELAHVLLGHTAEGQQSDTDVTPRDLRECEAEAVALICCAALDLPGVDEARGYIQSWWGRGNPIPERSAQRVLKVADEILKAGLRP